MSKSEILTENFAVDVQGVAIAGFDFQAAFDAAVSGVATDESIALDEKVRRMEVILEEGNSAFYREFIDLRTMAEQIELICSHDHALAEQLEQSSAISSFRDSYKDKHTDAEKRDKKQPVAQSKEHEKEKGNSKKKKLGWLVLGQAMALKHKNKTTHKQGWLEILGHLN